MRAVQLDVWSDFVCPFCYLAEPTLDELQQIHGDGLRVRWRAYELRPEPVPTLDPQGKYLREIWAQAVYPMAAERGMKLHLPPMQPRSRMAHEAVAFAAEFGKADALRHALFRAFFEAGEDIGDVEVLAQVAEKAGLDAGALRQALGQEALRDQVLADEQLARELRITGVPAMTLRAAEDVSFTNAHFVEGAQPLAVLQRAVEKLRNILGSTR